MEAASDNRFTAPPAAYTFTLLTGLYVAQGIPYGFFSQALPVVLREQGLSLKAISASGVLALPWAIKFLWGPLMDRVGKPRSWLVPLQVASAIVAAALTLIDLSQGFVVLFAAYFAFNLLSSVQDVSTDSLAVRLLDERKRGLANGLQVGAYRLGMVVGGGALLYVYASFGWRPMFLAMSLLLLLCALPSLWLKVPAAGASTAQSRMSLFEAATGWWQRLREPGVLSFVLLICIYKFGDTMGAALIGPYLHDLGLSKQFIALIKGTVGFTAGLAGAALGGWFAFAMGRRTAMLACGLLQTLSIALYGFSALHIGGMAMLWSACVGEHLFGGMATVALFTLMMDASDPRHAGTDYSLYACAIVIIQFVAGFCGAALADQVSYLPTFVVATLVCIVGTVLLVALVDRGAGPARLDAVWPARLRSAR